MNKIWFIPLAGATGLFAGVCYFGHFWEAFFVVCVLCIVPGTLIAATEE